MAGIKAIYDPEICFQQAMECWSSGDLYQAQSLLKQAFQYGKDPERVEVYVDLAEAFAGKELWREAEASLLEALRVDPDHREAAARLEKLHEDPDRFYDIRSYHDDEKVEQKRREGVISSMPRVQLFIELTNRCNGRCITCLHRTMKRNQGIMDLDLFKRIVDDSVENLYLEMVHLYGVGEVFLIPHVKEYFDYAQRQYGRRGIRTALITNGEQIRDLPPDVSEIDISFNAGKKESFERITGINFDRTVKNIWRLEREGQLGARTNIHMLVFDENENEIEDFKRLFAYTRANLVLAYKYDNQCGEIEDQTVQEYKTEQKIPCHYVRKVLNIGWNGDVILCPHDFEGVVNYGNLSAGSLKDIWYETKHKEMLAAHAACRFDGLCKACNYNVPIEGQNVIVSREERIALRKQHARFAWQEMIQCPYSEGCEIVHNYLENIDAIEGNEDELVSVCSTDWRFYGLDTVMDPARYPHCPGLKQLRERMDDSRVTWEAPTFGPSGYAFAARGYQLGLGDLGARVQVKPVWGDCLVETKEEGEDDG